MHCKVLIDFFVVVVLLFQNFQSWANDCIVFFKKVLPWQSSMKVLLLMFFQTFFKPLQTRLFPVLCTMYNFPARWLLLTNLW